MSVPVPGHLLHFHTVHTSLCLYIGLFSLEMFPESKQSLLLSARTAMWSMTVVLTETENENDSVNKNYVAKMTLQK